MPKPAGANRELFEHSHRRILEAATSLFGTRGFDAVAMTDVAGRAGVSHGSVFHHFGSKRDLFIAVHDRFQLALIERIDAAAAATRAPWTRFEAIWRAYLGATRDPPMRRILLLDGPRVIGLENLRARDRTTAFAFFSAEVARLQEAGLIDAGWSIRGLSVLLFGALDQAAFEIADFPDDDALARQLENQFSGVMQHLRTKADVALVERCRPRR